MNFDQSVIDHFAHCAPDLVERVARKLAERDGWNWDAVGETDTLSGNSPDEERDYYREIVLFVLQEASK